jgi:ZIP family zinc transporter
MNAFVCGLDVHKDSTYATILNPEVRLVDQTRISNERGLAITIHNFPEELAVGVSFGGGDVAAGLVIAMASGLQNMPEGLAVALPLVREGYSRRKSLLYGTLTGLAEPLGGLLGVALVSIFQPILPWGLAFAVGAMLFVVSDEMIPESHRKGFEREATFGVIAGFVIMMLLDCLFV